TLRLVRDPAWATITIPDHNRELIERVYHPAPREALANEPGAWEKAFIVNEDKNLRRTVHARGACIDFQVGYADNGAHFDPIAERRIRTRLGDDSIRIEIGVEVPSFYADAGASAPATTVDLPLRIVTASDDDTIVTHVSDVIVSGAGI